MTTQHTPETGGPAAPNPYGTPAAPMSKKELKVQKRMQKAARPWVARHKILTGALGIVGVAAVAGIAGGGEEDTSADAAADSTSAAPEAPEGSAPATTEVPAEEQPAAEEAVVEEAPAEEAAGAQVGMPVQVGDLDVTVTEVEPGIASVGDEYLGEQAQGQFVLVQVTMTNTGDSAATFFEQDAVLVDTEGRQHETSSASIYLDESSSWLITDINPGNTADGALLFDIPADAEADLLQVSAGLFSDDVDIRLR
ncbi:DUF4352 domain-containing protein [Georgenia sp. Z1344]|uniref:DUF4352 domain-containing protein n=1 Tax=Georgenia sp. Z1344 TaxID=3416706 RepID=UPI003CEA655F